MRLERALAGCDEGADRDRYQGVGDGAGLLGSVQVALMRATPVIAEQFGPGTGESAAKAFQKMADKVSMRRDADDPGREALREAKSVLDDARAVQTSFQGELNDPGEFRADPGADEIDQIRALRAHTAQKDAYAAAFAEREEKARQAVDNMERTYQQSTQTMKQVHGEPDAPVHGGGGGGGADVPSGGNPGSGGGGGGGKPPTFGGGGGGGTGGGGGGGGRHRRRWRWRRDPAPTIPVSSPVDGLTPGLPGVPQGPGESVPLAPTGATPGTNVPSSGPGGGTMGGIAGALGGGLMGGMAGIGGAVRGGGASTPASTGTRPIGSSSRTGAGGSLGRSASTPGAPASRAAGRAGRREQCSRCRRRFPRRGQWGPRRRQRSPCGGRSRCCRWPRQDRWHVRCAWRRPRCRRGRCRRRCWSQARQGRAEGAGVLRGRPGLGRRRGRRSRSHRLTSTARPLPPGPAAGPGGSMPAARSGAVEFESGGECR